MSNFGNVNAKGTKPRLSQGKAFAVDRVLSMGIRKYCGLVQEIF